MGVLHAQSTELDRHLQKLEASGEYDSMVLLLQHAMQHSDVTQTKKEDHLEKLIGAYIETGDYANASTGCEKLIEWEKDKPVKLAKAYSLKASAEYYLHNLPEAFSFTRKSFSVHRQLKDTIGMVKDLIRAGILCQEQKNDTAAIAQYRRAAALHTKDANILSNIYSCFGVAFSDMKLYDSSLLYIGKSIDLNRKLDPPDPGATVNSFYNLAATYVDLENYPMAIRYLDSAKRYDWSNVPDKLVSKIYAALYNSYFKLNNVDSGHFYLQLYIRHHEKVFKNKMDNEIHELTVMHEKEKILREQQQQGEIKTLKLQQWILGLLVAILVVVIAAGTGAYRSRLKKNKLEHDKVKIEQRLLRTQMNPHFMLNTLAGVQSYIEDGQPAMAILYLNSFARLLQITLEHSRENYISIDGELKALENYLVLQKMRFGNEFDYTLDVTTMPAEVTILLPPMIIQPFVENAIQHGVRGNDRKGLIRISITLADQTVVCVIDDNGRGLQRDPSTSRERQSLSTQIVRERLAILRAETGRKADVQIIDKKHAGSSGVRVILTIPYITAC